MKAIVTFLILFVGFHFQAQVAINEIDFSTNRVELVNLGTSIASISGARIISGPSSQLTISDESLVCGSLRLRPGELSVLSLNYDIQADDGQLYLIALNDTPLSFVQWGSPGIYASSANNANIWNDPRAFIPTSIKSQFLALVDPDSRFEPSAYEFRNSFSACESNPNCSINEILISNLRCNHNGSEADDTDDYFEFELTVNGDNIGEQVIVSLDPSDSDPFIVKTNCTNCTTLASAPGTANKQEYTLIIQTMDGQCTERRRIIAPTPCSNTSCLFSTDSFSIDCNNNGTGIVNDDYYELKIQLSSAVNGADSFFLAADPFDITNETLLPDSLYSFRTVDGANINGGFSFTFGPLLDGCPAITGHGILQGPCSECIIDAYLFLDTCDIEIDDQSRKIVNVDITVRRADSLGSGFARVDFIDYPGNSFRVPYGQTISQSLIIGSDQSIPSRPEDLSIVINDEEDSCNGNGIIVEYKECDCHVGDFTWHLFCVNNNTPINSADDEYLLWFSNYNPGSGLLDSFIVSAAPFTNGPQTLAYLKEPTPGDFLSQYYEYRIPVSDVNINESFSITVLDSDNPNCTGLNIGPVTYPEICCQLEDTIVLVIDTCDPSLSPTIGVKIQNSRKSGNLNMQLLGLSDQVNLIPYNSDQPYPLELEIPITGVLEIDDLIPVGIDDDSNCVIIEEIFFEFVECPPSCLYVIDSFSINCQDNGTANPSDDYYEIAVQFSSHPAAADSFYFSVDPFDIPNVAFYPDSIYHFRTFEGVDLNSGFAGAYRPMLPDCVPTLFHGLLGGSCSACKTKSKVSIDTCSDNNTQNLRSLNLTIEDPDRSGVTEIRIPELSDNNIVVSYNQPTSLYIGHIEDSFPDISRLTAIILDDDTSCIFEDTIEIADCPTNCSVGLEIFDIYCLESNSAVGFASNQYKLEIKIIGFNTSDSCMFTMPQLLAEPMTIPYNQLLTIDLETDNIDLDGSFFASLKDAYIEDCSQILIDFISLPEQCCEVFEQTIFIDTCDPYYLRDQSIIPIDLSLPSLSDTSIRTFHFSGFPDNQFIIPSNTNQRIYLSLGERLLAETTIDDFIIVESEGEKCFVFISEIHYICGNEDCQIYVDSFEVKCHDNGTSSDPSDDYYSLRFSISGENHSANLIANSDPFIPNDTLLEYDVLYTFTTEVGGNANLETYSFSAIDSENPDCFSILIDPGEFPENCSDQCKLGGVIIIDSCGNLECDSTIWQVSFDLDLVNHENKSILVEFPNLATNQLFRLSPNEDHHTAIFIDTTVVENPIFDRFKLRTEEGCTTEDLEIVFKDCTKYCDLEKVDISTNSETEICLDGGASGLFELDFESSLPDSFALVAINSNQEIAYIEFGQTAFLPANLEVGTYSIRIISLGALEELEIGQKISDLKGCFQLSNEIMISIDKVVALNPLVIEDTLCMPEVNFEVTFIASLHTIVTPQVRVAFIITDTLGNILTMVDAGVQTDEDVSFDNPWLMASGLDVPLSITGIADPIWRGRLYRLDYRGSLSLATNTSDILANECYHLQSDYLDLIVRSDSDCQNTTTVEDDIDLPHFDLYPNPSTGLIHFNRKVHSHDVKVFDLRGTIMPVQIDENATNIDLSPLPSGTYIISIIQGNQKLHKRVVKF